MSEFEIEMPLHSLEHWLLFKSTLALNPNTLDSIISYIKVNGIVEPITELTFKGSSINIERKNLRESISCRGINSRMRATLKVISRLIKDSKKEALKIYAAEAVTPFALRLRGIFPRFIGSEFAADDIMKESLFPIQHEDLMSLSFPSDSFDIVSTNEVLEHVPDLDRALYELARITKPGGYHVGTHPFRFTSNNSLIKARLASDGIEYLTEPEYHGNPISENGSLVFEIPGWDILQRCRAAGFSEAQMCFIMSRKHGILSGDAGGIFVLVAKK